MNFPLHLETEQLHVCNVKYCDLLNATGFVHISRSLNSVCNGGNYMTNINLSEARMKYDDSILYNPWKFAQFVM